MLDYRSVDEGLELNKLAGTIVSCNLDRQNTITGQCYLLHLVPNFQSHIASRT